MKDPHQAADICTHLGDDYDRYLGAIVPPLFQNTLFTRKHEKPHDRNTGKEAGGIGTCA